MESAVQLLKELKEEGLPVPFQNSRDRYYIKRESIGKPYGTVTETYVVTKNDKKIGTVETMLWDVKVHGDPECETVYKVLSRCILHNLAEVEYRQAAEDQWASKNKTE